MTVVRFFVQGEPVAWQRAIPHKNGRTMGAHTERASRAWKRRVGLFANVAMRGRAPLTGPIVLGTVFQLPIPPSWPKKSREAALRQALHPCAKPDFDNLAKAISDAGNGILWRDDAEVVFGIAWKRYSNSPGVLVSVYNDAEIAEFLELGNRLLLNAEPITDTKQ